MQLDMGWHLCLHYNISLIFAQLQVPNSHYCSPPRTLIWHARALLQDLGSDRACRCRYWLKLTKFIAFNRRWHMLHGRVEIAPLRKPLLCHHAANVPGPCLCMGGTPAHRHTSPDFPRPTAFLGDQQHRSGLTHPQSLQSTQQPLQLNCKSGTQPRLRPNMHAATALTQALLTRAS